MLLRFFLPLALVFSLLCALDSISLGLTNVEFTQQFESAGLCCFTKFRKVSELFLESFFSSTFSLLTWDSNDMVVFVVLSSTYLQYSAHFSVYILLFKVVNFYCSIFKFMDPLHCE